MKFMFGELMIRIEKLETRSGDIVKRVKKLGRRRVLVETLQMKPRMILTVVVGFVHKGERGMRINQGGDIFIHIRILSIEGISKIWVM